MTIEQILLQDIRENPSLEKRATAVQTYLTYYHALLMKANCDRREPEEKKEEKDENGC